MTAPDAPSQSKSVFMYPDVIEAITRIIAERTDEIICAAEAGEPPVAVLIPDLSDMISEGFYWRRAEVAIKELLSENFEVVGKKLVGLTGLPRGRCYRRIVAE